MNPRYEDAIKASASSIVMTNQLMPVTDATRTLIAGIMGDLYGKKTAVVMSDLKAAENLMKWRK